jgi:polyphosphate glucokinase
MSAVELGIDVGGTTVKGAMVDVESGALVSARWSVPTIAAATPKWLADVVSSYVVQHGWGGPIGCALPGVVAGSHLRAAPNLAAEWANEGSIDAFSDFVGAEVVVLNDADAAGSAEATFGHDPVDGLTVVLTFGTGIGSAIISDGVLIERSELGGLRGTSGAFEDVASARAVVRDHLTPQRWATRAQPYFDQIEALLEPHRWIVGGGLSNSFSDYFDLIDLAAPIRPAALGTNAGIIGAALAATSRDTASS